jgi:uncharacterized membrane protein (DUF2068 family)
MEIIILDAWAVWKTRNAFVSQNARPSLFKARTFFKEELSWIKYRQRALDIKPSQITFVHAMWINTSFGAIP